MGAVHGLRSAYAKVGQLVYFGRMLDKIRLADENKLPAGYNLGDQVPTWFDGNCCRFLHLEYARIVGRVRLATPTNRFCSGLTKQENVRLRKRLWCGIRLWRN